MRAIMLMFDTLTRNFLPNYGCDFTIMPNFKRLEDKCTTFDEFYGGSMPCMPARRELHTGKYNFLHRGWGPLEPYDVSCIQQLKNNGVYTQIIVIIGKMVVRHIMEDIIPMSFLEDKKEIDGFLKQKQIEL